MAMHGPCCPACGPRTTPVFCIPTFLHHSALVFDDRLRPQFPLQFCNQTDLKMDDDDA